MHEIAFLAALPKAPSRYNPTINYELALNRRNWVLERMLVNGYLNNNRYEYYKKPIETFLNIPIKKFSSDYYLEK